VFRAIAVMTQLSINFNAGERLLECGYKNIPITIPHDDGDNVDSNLCIEFNNNKLPLFSLNHSVLASLLAMLRTSEFSQNSNILQSRWAAANQWVPPTRRWGVF
jgi:hypothetical protein